MVLLSRQAMLFSEVWQRHKDTPSCTSTFQASLVSHLLTSYWPKQVTWPGLDSRSRKIHPTLRHSLGLGWREDRRIVAICNLLQSSSYWHLCRILNVYLWLPVYFSFHLILTTALWGYYFCFPHFIEEETEPER